LHCCWVSAESLNNHYVCISTDTQYQTSERVPVSANDRTDYISEWEVFNLIDRLRPTATGLDQLPVWFLRLSAPVIYAPLTRLITMSVSSGLVPWQWKQTSIRPIRKVPAPSGHADFRPISINPVLTTLVEKAIVRTFLYPAFLKPPPSVSFQDQYAFRPTGSTTAAIISIVHTITSLLITNPFVIVIAIDFSKAFVQFVTPLLQKIAQLDIPEHVYNSITEF